VVGLQECEGFDAIWVVVDRLSQMPHFIPCYTTTDLGGLETVCLRELVRLHGLSKIIVLNREPQFASIFLGQICNQLGIEQQLSTAFYVQTDGQTEQMNASMEQYLWVFGNHQQDDWVQWFSLAEFAANNGVSESSKCITCFAVQGTDPRISFAGVQTQEPNPRPLDADESQPTMQHVHEHLQVVMNRSQVLQEDGANRGCIPAVNIQVGSKVWLDARNI